MLMDSLVVDVHVRPGAKRAEVRGEHDGALCVAVRERAIDGRANAAVVVALAEAFGVTVRAVDLENGDRGRRKRLRVQGDPLTLARTLSELKSR